MRRAQAEIIGLVLILILLAVGFLLYVRFGLMSPESTMRESYESTQFGQSFVDSLAKSTLKCGGVTYTVQELITEIAKGTTRCPAETTLSQDVRDILDATLDKWGINYRLVIVRRGAVEQGIGLANFTNPNIPSTERCSNAMDTISVDAVPIAGVVPAVEMRLEQC